MYNNITIGTNWYYYYANMLSMTISLVAWPKNTDIHNNLSEPVQKKSFSVEIWDMKKSNVSNNINMLSHQFTPYLPTKIFFFFLVWRIIKKRESWKLLHLLQNVNCFHLYERDVIFSFIFKNTTIHFFNLPSNKKKEVERHHTAQEPY